MRRDKHVYSTFIVSSVNRLQGVQTSFMNPNYSEKIVTYNPRTIVVISLGLWLLLGIAAAVVFEDFFAVFFAPAALLPEAVIWHSWWDGWMGMLFRYFLAFIETVAISASAYLIWRRKSLLLSWTFAGSAIFWGLLLVALHLRIENHLKYFMR